MKGEDECVVLDLNDKLKKNKEESLPVCDDCGKPEEDCACYCEVCCFRAEECNCIKCHFCCGDCGFDEDAGVSACELIKPADSGLASIVSHALEKLRFGKADMQVSLELGESAGFQKADKMHPSLYRYIRIDITAKANAEILSTLLIPIFVYFKGANDVEIVVSDIHVLAHSGGSTLSHQSLYYLLGDIVSSVSCFASSIFKRPENDFLKRRIYKEFRDVYTPDSMCELNLNNLNMLGVRVFDFVENQMTSIMHEWVMRHWNEDRVWENPLGKITDSEDKSALSKTSRLLRDECLTLQGFFDSEFLNKRGACCNYLSFYKAIQKEVVLTALSEFSVDLRVYFADGSGSVNIESFILDDKDFCIEDPGEILFTRNLIRYMLLPKLLGVHQRHLDKKIEFFRKSNLS